MSDAATPWHASAFGRWLVAARSDRVTRTPLAVTVLGRPLVLARLAGGEVLALEDRCPHRQVPLSAGKVTPAGLQCAYHGWVFAADGRCTAMPGLAASACLPEVRARAVSVQELDGLVWVRLAAEGDAAPPALIRQLPAGSRRFLWQTAWQAHVVDAMENFLDPLHTHLVHPGLVRQDGARHAVTASLRATAEGFRVDYTGQPEQSGLLYRLFESPRESESAEVAGAGTAQIVYRYRNAAVVRITLHFTPETGARTQVFTTLHVENRWAPAWAVRLFVWPFLRRVAMQDGAMLALQSANQQRFGSGAGFSTQMDLVRPALEALWWRGGDVIESRVILHL